MKALALLLLSGIIAAGCASSEKKSLDKSKIENLVEIHPPLHKSYTKSKVYIDSVQLIDDNDRRALLVSGSFPDGCTRLDRAAHTVNNGEVELSLSAWRDPEMMCAQVLTPFSFIYNGLAEEELDQRPAILINGTTFEIK